MERAKVVSLYEGFFSGGARILHTEVVLGLHQEDIPHSIVSINSKTYRECTVQPMEEDWCYRRLTAAGVAVSSLGRYAGKEPDYSPFTADEQAAFVGHVAGAKVILSLKEQPVRLANQADIQVPVIACLHRSDPEHQGLALDELIKGVRSGRVAAVAINARSAIRAYTAVGIPEDKMHFIPNGIDTDRFAAHSGARAEVRKDLAIGPSAPVVAFAARYDDMKDIPLFLASTRCYLEEEPGATILMCGAGMVADNPRLLADLQTTFADRPDLLRRVKPLGIRRDMERIYAAADVIALTSRYGETQPLCLMEGLACGAVPVTTDVGDSTTIVGEGRGIVTSREAAEIASAWQQAYDNRAYHRAAMSASRHHFDSQVMVAAYGQLIAQYSRR